MIQKVYKLFELCYSFYGFNGLKVFFKVFFKESHLKMTKQKNDRQQVASM